ncbi:germin-like protein subfamily 1 member 13 [Cucurbita pepo subsp. pepo]|uniref:germin-like protein subfamily 1 member 13 n=1 Tax=Cucurbita pepo subsp. pepo TaxID=3664 RepID=UPI000C9D34DD|nr:germin-like protein subfamily 1 member 13 [Cucurbita pepo subsp. pepo]
MASKILLSLAIFAAACSSLALASDPSPLQDFCVADKENPVKVNGFVCKDPMQVNADDFFASGLQTPAEIKKDVGSGVTTINVDKLHGLNTLGISMVRIDFIPQGINPPHTHPRATEILTLLEGTLLVGFVSSNQDGNRLFSKVLYKGDVFVFPEGMVHFQQNVGYENAVAIAALSSQNAGVITIANTVFGSEPAISIDILAKAFQTHAHIIAAIQAKF